MNADEQEEQRKRCWSGRRYCRRNGLLEANYIAYLPIFPVVIPSANRCCTPQTLWPMGTEPDSPGIATRIRVIRGQRVLLDTDLAALYGVTAKRLNEQVRRNNARFPGDFMFTLTEQELSHLRSHFATSNATNPGRGGRRYLPLAFTEHGAVMAASVLNSARAVEMSVFVVRACVRLKAFMASNATVTRKLDVLEKSFVVLDADSLKISEGLM